MVNFKKKISKATWTENAANTEKIRNPRETLADERKGRNELGDVGADGRIILKRITGK
jgi:hypothetical protein